MQVSKSVKSLVIAACLVILAGCSSTGGTQRGQGGADRAGGEAAQDAASGQVSGTRLGQVQGQRQGSGQDQQGQGRIPSQRTIYFDYDKETIRPEFESTLNAHAQYLRANPDTKVILQGHGDERGTREYNLGLGERRAKAVERYLAVQGIPDSRVEIVSYGEERPAIDGHSEDAYAQNRRVVFDY